MRKTIYLDYAAATPMDKQVLLAIQPYFAEEFYNPSAIYLAAKDVGRKIEDARAKVAQVLGARSSEIVFTGGGTEANNLAIKGVMERFPGSNIVTSAVEHESVLAPAHQYNSKNAPVNKEGIIDLLRLEKLIDDKTVLVSVIYANNEIGTVQSIKDIANLLERIRKSRKNKLPLYLHTNACQAGAYLGLSVSRLGVDLMTINGGKIYGPKQSGVLFVKTGVVLQPQILGGGQERGLRSGTENVAGIVGLSKALVLAQSRRITEGKRLQALQDLFFELIQKNIPGVVINGSLVKRLPNNVHMTIPGQDNERIIMELDEKGIQCAAGSACSASNEEPSHVLRAIGLSSKEAQSSLRFSMGNGTAEQDVRGTVKLLSEIVK